jgi:hypothetical protein
VTDLRPVLGAACEFVRAWRNASDCLIWLCMHCSICMWQQVLAEMPSAIEALIQEEPRAFLEAPFAHAPGNRTLVVSPSSGTEQPFASCAAANGLRFPRLFEAALGLAR